MRVPAEQIAASLEAFLRERFRIPADDPWFTRRTNLWEDGYVDSVGAVELMGHIETTFGVELPDEALFDPDFSSVDGIARIVSGLPAR